MAESPARTPSPHRRPAALPALLLAGAGGGVVVPAALAPAAAPAATSAPAPAPVPGHAPADPDDPFRRTLEVDGLELSVRIRATGYAWTLTNRVGSSVRTVTIPIAHTAGIDPPDGWSYVVEDDVLRLTADRGGLRVGTSITLLAQTPFDMARVATGTVTATRLDGEPIVFDDVWVPGRKRPAAWWLVAGGVAAAGVLHLVVVEMRARRRRAATGG